MQANTKPDLSVISFPTCCETHRKSYVKRRDMDTSEWRFIDDDYTGNLSSRQFDPWKSQTSATQQKEKCMELMDLTLEQETREAALEEIRKSANNEGSLTTTSLFPNRNSEESEDESERKENEVLASLKEFKLESNPYLVLINRLDEEEGIKTPSVEDKLKLAEDRLRVSVNNFCEACDELLETSKTSDPDQSKVNRFLIPKIVRDAFRPKVLDPSLLPPQTLSVSESNNKPMAGIADGMEETELSKHRIKKKKFLKQGFYLPPETWFTPDKVMDKLTLEEMELLNSTSTKAFLKFLEDRKKEPPKILQDIQEKLQETQKHEKQNKNEK